MSKEAMKLALEVMQNQGDVSVDEWIAAEKSLREALAEQPAQQEPVAKKTRIGLVTSSGWDSLPVGTEFYTSPPAQRTWVGLTDEEIDDIYQGVGKNELMLVREVEAKLKEKNT
jgi:hypothetical protein